VTVVFGGKAVLTWCRNGNAVSRECLGDEGGEPLGPAITDGDGGAMMVNWLRTASGLPLSLLSLLFVVVVVAAAAAATVW
jgi:hypothetical protein